MQDIETKRIKHLEEGHFQKDPTSLLHIHVELEMDKSFQPCKEQK